MYSQKASNGPTTITCPLAPLRSFSSCRSAGRRARPRQGAPSAARGDGRRSGPSRCRRAKPVSWSTAVSRTARSRPSNAAHVHLRGAQHEVVGREHRARGHRHPHSHPLVAEHRRRGMLLGDGAAQEDDGGDDGARDRDGCVQSEASSASGDYSASREGSSPRWLTRRRGRRRPGGRTSPRSIQTKGMSARRRPRRPPRRRRPRRRPRPASTPSAARATSGCAGRASRTRCLRR